MAVAEMKESGWHPPLFETILIHLYAIQIPATVRKN
jgi:hypothetical protein